MLRSTGEWRLPMADKWLTFDCYGTVADWNSCMGGALEGVVGGDASRLLTAYHQAELEREAEREQVTLPHGGEETFVRAWPDMPVFADSGPALTALRERGWRLAFL